MRKMLKLSAVSVAALSLALCAGAAFAEESTVPSHTLGIYAAMAKLEANKAEAAGAVMFASIDDVTPEQASEAREDFESDATQITEYIAALKDMPLTDGQAEAVTLFEQSWLSAVEQATAIMDGDAANKQAAAFEWWESLDELDDLIDDQLEEILESAKIML